MKLDYYTILYAPTLFNKRKHFIQQDLVDIDRVYRDNTSVLALELIYSHTKIDKDVVELLLKKSSTVKLQSEIGYNLLHLLVIHVKSENYNDIDYLIDLFVKAGIDINLKGSENQTPLIIAAQRHNDLFSTKIIKKLIECGANVHLQDENGYTALMYALSRFNIDSAKLLINHGAFLKVDNCNSTLNLRNQYPEIYLACLSERLTKEIEELKQGKDSHKINLDYESKDSRDLLNLAYHEIPEGLALFKKEILPRFRNCDLDNLLLQLETQLKEISTLVHNCPSNLKKAKIFAKEFNIFK